MHVHLSKSKLLGKLKPIKIEIFVLPLLVMILQRLKALMISSMHLSTYVFINKIKAITLILEYQI